MSGYVLYVLLYMKYCYAQCWIYAYMYMFVNCSMQYVIPCVLSLEVTYAPLHLWDCSGSAVVHIIECFFNEVILLICYISVC